MQDNEMGITLKQFSEKFEWPTPCGLRTYRHKAKELGIEKAFVTVGWRVLIRVETFFELAKKNGLKPRVYKKRGTL